MKHLLRKEKLTNLSRTIDELTIRIGRWNNWLILIMTVVAGYNAITRYLGKYLGLELSSNALLELQWYLFSVIFLLGGSYALQQDAHVKIDIVYNRLDQKKKYLINILGTLLFLLPFSLLMIIVSIPSVINSWKVLEMSPDPGGLPRFPLKTFIPLAFFLLFLQGVSFLLKNVIRYFEEDGLKEKTLE